MKHIIEPQMKLLTSTVPLASSTFEIMYSLFNGTKRRTKQNYQASIMPMSVLPLTPMTIIEVQLPWPEVSALVMLQTSLSLGVSESVKERAEGDITVTRSSRACTHTQPKKFTLIKTVFVCSQLSYAYQDCIYLIFIQQYYN